MMRVPELLRVQLRADPEADLSGLIVELRVTTGFKNPYYILFPKTTAEGEAELSRADFVGQFKDHWESGLMDYQGGPDDALSMVRVSLFDPGPSLADPRSALAWPLFKHEATKWRSREEEYAYRISCRNASFESIPLAVDLHATAAIVLSVRDIGRAV
jgi:hypothetical protein